MSEKKGILMICLGNICRSPIAEAVMIDVIKKQNLSDKFKIDSAAIGKLIIDKVESIASCLIKIIRSLACWKESRSSSSCNHEKT